MKDLVEPLLQRNRTELLQHNYSEEKTLQSRSVTLERQYLSPPEEQTGHGAGFHALVFDLGLENAVIAFGDTSRPRNNTSGRAAAL
ncbi:hypothetical protein [Pseudomonas syringae]|uniref:hypothetical protein n=1 Tax=Pseudomonas syringae TaxID=317 RepID=UPI00246531FD|nr:hypothetical protein [Pseudomonas syringae]MDH4602480.1 hypothetical protein [Pseudomonas syringae pv. papulans]